MSENTTFYTIEIVPVKGATKCILPIENAPSDAEAVRQGLAISAGPEIKSARLIQHKVIWEKE